MPDIDTLAMWLIILSPAVTIVVGAMVGCMVGLKIEREIDQLYAIVIRRPGDPNRR